MPPSLRYKFTHINSHRSFFSSSHLQQPRLQPRTKCVTQETWRTRCQGSLLRMLISASASHSPRNCPVHYKFSHHNWISGRARWFPFTPVCSQSVEQLTGSKGYGPSNVCESVLTLASGSMTFIAAADLAGYVALTWFDVTTSSIWCKIALTGQSLNVNLSVHKDASEQIPYLLHFVQCCQPKNLTLRGCAGWHNVLPFKGLYSLSILVRIFDIGIKIQHPDLHLLPSK